MSQDKPTNISNFRGETMAAKRRWKKLKSHPDIVVDAVSREAYANVWGIIGGVDFDGISDMEAVRLLLRAATCVLDTCRKAGEKLDPKKRYYRLSASIEVWHVIASVAACGAGIEFDPSNHPTSVSGSRLLRFAQAFHAIASLCDLSLYHDMELFTDITEREAAAISAMIDPDAAKATPPSQETARTPADS